MPSEKINTSATLKQNTKPEAEIKADLEKAAKQLKSQATHKLTIPDVYRAAFGDPMMFSVNGVRVEIPIGEEVMVSEAHYKHAQRLMKGAVLNKTQRRLEPNEIY